MEKKEEEMKKAGATKEEIQEMRKQKNALGVKNSNKQHKKGKVKLLKEEDVVDDDENEVVEDQEDAEDFEPKKGKKMKVDVNRLKSYGLM